MTSTLIIGYGNPDREDDGIAWHVLAEIAQRLDRMAPDTPEEVFMPEGLEPDLWFVLQLTPEMAEVFANYERICFVDAHTGNIPKDIQMEPVSGSPASSAFTHHMTPAACLALVQTLYGAKPEALLLSIRGYQFGFTRKLSARTATLLKPAVERLWGWLESDTLATNS